MQKQSNIDQFHTYLNTVLSELLENQIRTRSFITGVQQYKNQIAKNNPTSLSNDSQKDWHALINSNAQLIKLGTLSWERSIDQIKNLLVKCDHLVRELHKAMIDRELYEHQGRVLQGIILSHDKIENWEEFAQSILREFHTIFEFNFFSITFHTHNGIELDIYYMGEFPAKVMAEAKKELSLRIKPRLCTNKTLSIKEYQVLDQKLEHIDINLMHSVTINVDEKQDSLGGLFEMGYFSSVPLGIDEESIIRSILSVMVMVIGSSRTLKKTLTELDYQAKQDPLTGLYNRRHFNSFLESEIERSKRHQHAFCILMLDLDNFKGINDSFGHLCGDTVLQGIAQILKNKIRRGDLIARLGGDEFAIILPETHTTGAHYVAEEIKMAIEAHHFSNEHYFNITASIGLISYPKHATSLTELLSKVDIALYQAKDDGRNNICEYDSSLNSRNNTKKNFELSQDLTLAIRESRIIAHFQPIVTCTGQSIFAYEALARLINKEDEIISADKFINAANQSGISTDFDKCMIQNVTNTLLNVFDKTEDYPLVFINLTPISVHKRGILHYASSVCKEKGIPPERIVFEISEREAISDISGIKQFLAELRNQGFAFALDDFGSAYNSFYYLRELYFEYVKIDGELVKNLLHSKVDYALVESLHSLCEKLGIKTIAKFVEHDGVLKRLQELGVTYCQGFYTGCPDSKFRNTDMTR